MNMKITGVEVSRHEPNITADVFKNLWIMDGTNNNNNNNTQKKEGKRKSFP